MTFIGPWNEFLWPFLITKQHDLQPLAIPAVVVFVAFQRHFVQSNLGSGVKG